MAFTLCLFVLVFLINILYLAIIIIIINNNAHKKQQRRRRKNLYFIIILYKYNINIKTIIGYRKILIYINQSIMSSKYEGKTSDGGGGKTSESNEDTNSFEVTALTVEPNNCLLQEELNIIIQFESNTNLNDATWNFQYMVDSVRKRHIIILGSLEGQDIKIGSNSCEFHVDTINVSGIRPSRLANVGLLSATLNTKNEEEVLTINMVVQVAKSEDNNNGGGGSKKSGDDDIPNFTRCIFNPLE